MASKEVIASGSGVESQKELSSEDKEFYLNIKPQTGYDLSLFMVGITGAGKSSFCNFLCNKEEFEVGGGFMSVSQIVSLCRFKFDSKEVLIIDSPGFCDSDRSDQEIFDELCKVGVMAKDGTDAVALVINSCERFSDNHRKALLMMEQMGGSFWEHTFIVFTKECEVLKRNKVKSGEEYLTKMTKHPKCPSILKEMLEKTENRYVFVDSIEYFQKEEYRNNKCAQIFKLIDEIHQKNGHKRYNNNLMNQGKKFFSEIELAQNKAKLLRDELDAKNKQMADQEEKMKINEELRRKEAEEARKQEEWRRQETERLRREQEKQAQMNNNKVVEKLKKEIKEQELNALKEKNKTLEKEKEEEKLKFVELKDKHVFQMAGELVKMQLENNENEMEKKILEYKLEVAEKQTWRYWWKNLW